MLNQMSIELLLRVTLSLIVKFNVLTVVPVPQ